MHIVFYSTSSNIYDGEKTVDTSLPSRASVLESFALSHPEHTFTVATQLPGMFLLDVEKNEIKEKAPHIQYCLLQNDDEELIAEEIAALKPDLVIAASFYVAPFDWLTIKDALVAEKLRHSGIKTVCHSLEFARDCFDKWRTHQLLEKQGIKTPRAVYLHHELFNNGGNRSFIKSNVYRTSVLEQIKKLRFPVVIKDCTGLSSYGMDVVNSFEEAKQIIFSKKTTSDRIIEEFISGTQAGIEIIKTEEKTEILPAMIFSVNRYGITSPKQSVKAGPVTGGRFKLIELKSMAEKIAALPGFMGLAQIDLVFDGNEWFVIEINPRLSGMTTTYEAMTETSVFEKLLCSAENKTPQQKLNYCFNIKFPLLEKTEMEKMKALPFVHSVHQIENLGAKQLRETGYLEVIITAENKKMLQERLIQLKEAFPDSMEEIFYKKAEEIILKLQEPEQD